ncbi:MAG: hypothetical protein MJY83_07975 [Bacteroidales bacterium]|nr:hypothetical protein [Bacteroidales bacterium]
MTEKDIKALIQESKWSDLLKGLPIGTHQLFFPSNHAIRSCKAVAYSLNTDRIGKTFRFKVDKEHCFVTLTIR